MIRFNLTTDIHFGRVMESGELVPYPEFMERAGYPRPYPLQVKMKEYFFDEPWTTPVKMLLATRYYGKTDYISIGGSAYAIYKDEKYETLLVTKLASRGKEYLGEIRRCLVANNVHVTSKGNSRVIVSGHIGKEPNAFALSIKSTGLRSRHPRDITFLEDIVTPTDCSAKERAKVFQGYEELLKVSKKVGIVGQPVHALDMYQLLRKKVPTLEIRYGAIPELDADLDAMRAAGVSEKSIQASYFLNIEDSLDMPFLKTSIVYTFPSGTSVMVVDPAKKGGGNNDYTAIVCGRMHFDKFVMVGFAYRKAWHNCLDEMRIISDMFNAECMYFETNFSGQDPVDKINDLGMPCYGFDSKGNKHGRIMRMAPHVAYTSLVKVNIDKGLNEANETFIDLYTHYEYNAEKDDPPDAASSLMEKVGLIYG